MPEGNKPTELEWLEQWMAESINVKDRDGESIIDLVFEWLVDQDMLKKNGRKLAKEFWEKYVRKE